MLSSSSRHRHGRIVSSALLAGLLVLAACVVDRPDERPVLPRGALRSAEATAGPPSDLDSLPTVDGAGGASGGFPLGRGFGGVFSVSYLGSTARVDVLVVGRTGERRSSRLPSWPPDSIKRGPGGGASIGSVSYWFDRDASSLWIGAEPWLPGRWVFLGGNNVVLVENADGEDGEPRVVKMLQVDPAINVTGSLFGPDLRRRHEELMAALQAKVRSQPAARAFLTGSEG